MGMTKSATACYEYVYGQTLLIFSYYIYISPRPPQVPLSLSILRLLLLLLLLSLYSHNNDNKHHHQSPQTSTMARVYRVDRVGPTEKIHKEYLCILNLFGGYEIEDIVRVLDYRFGEALSRRSRQFGIGATLETWERMRRDDDEELVWARGLRDDDRKVRAVMKRAREVLAPVRMV